MAAMIGLASSSPVYAREAKETVARMRSDLEGFCAQASGAVMREEQWTEEAIKKCGDLLYNNLCSDVATMLMAKYGRRHQVMRLQEFQKLLDPHNSIGAVVTDMEEWEREKNRWHEAVSVLHEKGLLVP